MWMGGDLQKWMMNNELIINFLKPTIMQFEINRIVGKKSYWGYNTFVVEIDSSGVVSMSIFNSLLNKLEATIDIHSVNHLNNMFNDKKSVLKLFANNNGHSNFDRFFNNFKYNV